MYDDKFPQYNEVWKDREVVSKTDVISIGYDYPFDSAHLEMELWRSRTGGPMVVGVSTGRFGTHAGVTFVQILGGFGASGYGYVKLSDINQNAGKIIKRASDPDAQQMLNELLYNQKQILENNLLSAGMIAALDKKGVEVPVHQREQLAKLQNRLTDRNNRLLKSPYLKAKKQASPPGFVRYEKELAQLTYNPYSKIGAVPVVAIIVVSVVITALVGWIVYLIFKPDYTDSKADLKISKELNKALDQLDPEARQVVINDLEGQVSRAYVEGKLSGSGRGMLRTVGYAAAGLLGFVFFNNFLKDNK